MKQFLRRALSLLCALVLIFTLAGCDKNDEDGAENGTQNPPAEETHMLNGKKIIFIGDSFVYYGQVVLEKTQSVLSDSKRKNDHGYFYQLCRAKGAEVSVTNFTFGGHGLASFCGEACNTEKDCAGVNHFSYLKDRNYDYVVVSGERASSRTKEYLFENMDIIMNMFREVNPDVKFLYLVSSGAHNVSVAPSLPHNILNSLDELEAKGVTIVDWGKMVADIINGKVSVPGATLEYNKNTFIIDDSQKDGYHPNQLAGYIESLMLYCAITGESAVGQPYAFWNDTSLRQSGDKNHFFNPDKFIERYYEHGPTNYDRVFESESDMLGLQQLIDGTLAEKAYLTYNFEPLA